VEVEPSMKTLRLLLSMPPEMELKPEASRGSLKVMEKEEPEASTTEEDASKLRKGGVESEARVEELETSCAKLLTALPLASLREPVAAGTW